MRIGIFGGSFNPIHLGHLILAEFVLEALKLDRIIFVPAYIAPLKSSRSLTDCRQRLNMLRLATGDNKKFSLSDIEIKRKGISYTVDTLTYFKRRFKDATLFFITGSDSLSELDRWKDLDKILRLVKFVVIRRPGATLKTKRKSIKILSMPQIEISSSDIRRRKKRGRPIRYLVTDKVLRFIKQKGLYG